MEERDRIARELHDSVAQKLFSLRLTADAAAALVERDPAGGVEPVQTEMFLVRRDLEHAVGGGVADRTAGLDMLGSEMLDDRGPGGVAIAEDARQARL